MTLIAGVIEGGAVWMGGDSAFSDMDTHQLSTRANRKVFINGDCLIGICGSPRVIDLVRYSFETPKLAKRSDPDRFMRTTFIDALRDVLRKGGSLHKRDDIENMDASMLVGFRGKLFEIEDDLQVGEPIDDFAAVGSGRDVALGALSVSQGVPPRKRLLNALNATERYIVSVRRPFYVMTVE